MAQRSLPMAAEFAQRLLHWFDRHGRHDLPWQHPRTPYRVWLSEVMLQQTQVATVIPYFTRFLDRFPSLTALAEASEDAVFAQWSGLGYYSRARNLHRAAQQCVAEHGGELPDTREALQALPGIGRSTAGAILAQAFGRREAILDGNVKRVLTRHLGIDQFPGLPAVERALWRAAEARLPETRLPDYTQALMDLGATVCTRRRPQCAACPVRGDCIAHAQDRTAELPVRAARKSLPERQTRLLVLQDERGAVLLEKRGPGAVWNGLWSLPEAADAGAVVHTLSAWNADGGETLPDLNHVFSHYRLRAAVSRHACRPQAVADGDRWRWCRRDDWRSLGLPTPIRRLLESL
jgi:A/G-specific adenine glycosylase